MSVLVVPRTFGGTLLIITGPSSTAIAVTAIGRDGKVSSVGRDGKLTAIAQDGKIIGKGL